MKSNENERTKLHTIEIQYYYGTTIRKKRKISMLATKVGGGRRQKK